MHELRIVFASAQEWLKSNFMNDQLTAPNSPQRSYLSFLCWFALVAALNVYYVFDPVYWDMLMGMFVQIRWLAQHDLNYLELLRQPDFFHGGACIYPFAWLPTLGFSLLYKLGASFKEITIIGHVLIWCCTAWILSTLQLLLKPFLEWRTRVLFCGAVLSCPLLLSQSSTFNMETVITAFGFLAFVSYYRGQVGRSVAFSVIAYHMHPRGVISLLVIGAISLFDLLQMWRLKRIHDSESNTNIQRMFRLAKKSVLLHALGFLLFIAYVKGISVLMGVRPADTNSALLSAFSNPNNVFAVILIPEFSLMMVGATLFTIPTIARIIKRNNSQSENASRNSETVAPQSIDRLQLYCFISVLVYIGFLLNVELILPRYHLFVYPVLLLGVLLLLLRVTQSVRHLNIILSACVLLNLLNYKGALYGLVYPNLLLANSGQHLECSMVYHDDVTLDRQIGEYVSREFDHNETIFVTHWPIMHVLSVPEAGYTQSPNVSVATSKPVGYTNVASLTDVYELPDSTSTIRQKSPDDVIWVISPNDFLFHSYGQDFPERLPHEVVHQMTVGERSAVFVKLPRTFSDERIALIIRRELSNKDAE